MEKELKGFCADNSGVKQQVWQEITALAKKYKVKRLVLFGSRARGDYHRTSDIDLAVTGGDYVRFALDVDEYTSTLLNYDIVCLDGIVQPELRRSIEKEGIVVYEEI